MKKRILSWLLCAAMIVGIIPAAAIPALADELSAAETISDRYISVSVSKKNGGFTVKTVEGDRLKKSDNDKNLLYHDGQYDTSFLSFRVGEGENARDYLFGGSYPDENSSDVSVSMNQTKDKITAQWSVAGLTFTQSISLAAQESNESGMVSISVSVKNESGVSVPVQARLLLDTCLGEQDFGYYQYADAVASIKVISAEQVITDVPQQLFAADDPYSPTVMAYTVHTSGSSMPTKAAFGHWSHLASTLFDFTPLSSLNFTDSRNEYLTADSAYALYYDLGHVDNGGEGSISTYYGVFSNHSTPASNSVAVNVTAPTKLALNETKTDFIAQVDHGIADFSVAVDFTNIVSDTAQDLTNLKLVVQTGKNLRPLSDEGEEVNGYDFTSTAPFTINYEAGLTVGQTENKTLYFEARPGYDASYERITIGVYATDENGQLSESNKLGERIVYVLLPGTDGDVPRVNFSAMTPKTVYTGGTRHLFVSVSNENLLNVDVSARKWTLYVMPEDSTQHGYEIGHSSITFKDGVMDVELSQFVELAEGGWYLEIQWDDSVVGDAADDIVTPEYRVMTSSELHFTVSGDEKYKNDSYGLLTVVEFPATSSSLETVTSLTKTYRILPFADEEELEKYKKDPLNYETPDGKKYSELYGNGKAYTEIIFVFKGEFSVSKKRGTDPVYYSANSTVTMVDGKNEVSNSILINDCLDFEGGNLSVYYEDYESNTYLDSAVCVEFDGKLYTNKERTSVWSGKAVFTKLEQNEADYSLVPYDENGNRISIRSNNGQLEAGEADQFEENNEPILLIWPTIAGIGQTISGMIFNLTYGQMGIMYETNEYGKIETNTDGSAKAIGTVVSFAASLDLSFATGRADGTTEDDDPDTYYKKLQLIWEYWTSDYSAYTYADAVHRAYRAHDWSDIDESGENSSEKRVSASVMVRDVLFGCGEGFVGVNFSVGVALANYISGLPEIKGTISVNTINNWSYSVDGEIDLEVFSVEANVSFRSHNNIPIPDNFYVFVTGFNPGINIDGMGVLWITGGGGGISNLYDSIFATKTVPPLKLIMSVSFDILKVFECEKATLALGLTGISLSAENIGLKSMAQLKPIRNMGLSLEWYPGIDLRANIVVDLLQGVIYGGGYIVLLSPDYQDVFFEMFARAELRVPNSIPAVGGMTLMGVDLGISTEKIWGAIKVLGIALGVTYYWGDDGVDFSSGSKVNPTFPELLGYEDIPVGYDAENDRTLFMRVGTNTQLMASNLPDNGGAILMGSMAFLKSDADKAEHRFDLGDYTGSDAIVQITFAADSLEDATTKAAAIRVGSAVGSDDYGLVLYQQTVDSEGNLLSSNAELANANLTYDPDTGKATYTFTATDSEKYDRTWYMTTPAGSDVLLYNVAEIPEVETVSGSLSGSEITLNWAGTELAELDQISFYLSSSNDPESTEPGRRIDVVTDSATLAGGSAVLTIPADVPTGDYYIRAVYSKSDEVNGVVFSTGEKLSWVNSATPGAVNILGAEPVGNLQYELTIAHDDNTTGYLVTIYDSEGNVTDFDQVSFEAAESGSTTITVGGSYTSTVEENGVSTSRSFGLVGDRSYTIGVTPYQKVASQNGEIAVRGQETLTAPILLPESVRPTVTSLTADQTAQHRTQTIYGTGNAVVDSTTVDVYTSDTVSFTAQLSEAATGTWKLDNGAETAFTDSSSVSIPLSGMVDGEHTLTISGAAADGDSFYETFCFTVDTMPPQLLLSSPVNGSFFGKDGTITLTGITDSDARFTVTCDDAAICTDRTIAQLGGSIGTDGVFTLTLNIPDADSASRRTLTISVSDDVGNATQPKAVTVSHGGLADIQSLEIMVNGQTYSNDNIPIYAGGLRDAQLTLVGVMSNGKKFNITGDNVYWEVLTVDGSAEVTDGKFTAEALSQGIITGKLAVANGAQASGEAYQAASYRSASVTFGASGEHMVVVSANTGGIATGGGSYRPGETVTLSAVANDGYRFAGWTLVGVTVADDTAATIQFTMPDSGNVTAAARFEPVNNPNPEEPDQPTPVPETEEYVIAKAGEQVQIRLPVGKNENNYLPYYLGESGEKIFVPISAVTGDGKVTFIAPKSCRYYFGVNEVSFTDISGRWSEENILFAAAREIFQGVGNDRFDPRGVMNRAMVITVLYRLAGSPAVSGSSGYTDVKDGRWYSDAVLWGKENGIILGYGDGSFGVNDPITREQLCTMLLRFLNYMGYELPVQTETAVFTDDAAISAWAEEAVSFCQTCGLIYGMPDGSFCPREGSTREQCCAIMERMIRAILGSGE